MEGEEIVFAWALDAGYTMVAVALALIVWRLLAGPTQFDRIVAIDFISALVMCLAGLYSLETGEKLFLDIALAVAIITFMGTVAFAKHLEKEKP